MRTLPFVAVLAAFSLGCGSEPPGSTGCVEGMTVACACSDGRMGAQTCQADGTYGTCVCTASEFDGGPGEIDSGVAVEDAGNIEDDAGGVATDDAGGCPAPYSACALGCFDLMTDEENCGACDDGTGSNVCAAGETCERGVCTGTSGCPAPFLMCGGECVDPRSSSPHCGATGACTGSSAGLDCGGSACSAGRCVGRSCLDLLRRGFSTGDGVYLVDADGGGPLGAIQVYCDMTTAGGGWTLVYKVRNNIHHLLDPWFPMVGLGSGDAFPLTLDAPASGAFDGPVQARRETYANAIAGGSGWESRATLREGSATLFDIWTTQTDVIGAFALGRDISSTTCSGFTSATGTVIENNLGMGVTAGHTGGRLCHTVSTSAGGGPDSASYYRSNSDGTIDYSFRFYGDSSLGRNDSHTLFWVRERRPD